MSNHADPILACLDADLRVISDNFHTCQAIRSKRGDTPKPGAPFLTVQVSTEHRTYHGRIFTVDRSEGFLDLYDTTTTSPTLSARPPHLLRAASIIAVQVHENLHCLPVEFPMRRTDLDTHTAAFLAKAAAILADPDYDETAETDPADILDRLCAIQAAEPVRFAHCKALRAAAQPVNDLIFGTIDIISRWERYTRNVCDSFGLTDPKHRQSLDTNPHLNIEILNTDDPTPGSTTLLSFLTHGVPINFLYPDTHQQALDAYRTQAKHASNTGS